MALSISRAKLTAWPAERPVIMRPQRTAGSVRYSAPLASSLSWKPSKLEPVTVAEHEPGRRADCGERAAGGIMLLHGLDERPAFRELRRAGHASGEYHEVLGAGAFVVYDKVAEHFLRTYGHSMRRLYERLVGNGDESGIDPSSAENVVGRESFDILEAVGQKYVNSFHRYLFFSVFRQLVRAVRRERPGRCTCRVRFWNWLSGAGRCPCPWGPG